MAERDPEIVAQVEGFRERIHRAAIRTLCIDPFLGHLAMSIPHVPAVFVPTAATDGVVVYYNPEFMEGLTDEEFVAVMAHELYHIALGHCLAERGAGFDRRLWNLALDAVVNGVIDDGYEVHGERRRHPLPPGAYRRPDLVGAYTEEEIYTILLREQVDQREFDRVIDPSEGEEGHSGRCAGPGAQEGSGSGSGRSVDGEASSGEGGRGDGNGDRRGGGSDGGPELELRPGPYGIQDQYGRVVVPRRRGMVERQRTVQGAVADAYQQALAHAAGSVPDGVRRLVESLVEPPIDWRQWIQIRCAEVRQPEESWRRLSPRTWAYGVARPGMVAGPTPLVGVIVDTSGSIGERDLAAFMGGLKKLFQTFPEARVVAVSCDADAYPLLDTEEIGMDAAVLGHVQSAFRRNVLERVKGGGGTSFVPGFDALIRRRRGVGRSAGDYTAVVVLTDGYPIEEDWASGHARRRGFRRVIYVVTGEKPDHVPDLPHGYAVAPLEGKWPGKSRRRAA